MGRAPIHAADSHSMCLLSSVRQCKGDTLVVQCMSSSLLLLEGAPTFPVAPTTTIIAVIIAVSKADGVVFFVKVRRMDHFDRERPSCPLILYRQRKQRGKQGRQRGKQRSVREGVKKRHCRPSSSTYSSQSTTFSNSPLPMDGIRSFFDRGYRVEAIGKGCRGSKGVLEGIRLSKSAIVNRSYRAAPR
jgi:hypothetical protein